MRSPATSDRKISASSLPPFLVYLAGLLAERQKLGPFPQVFPFFCRRLNQGMLSYIHMAFLVSSYCSWMVFWFTITIFLLSPMVTFPFRKMNTFTEQGSFKHQLQVGMELLELIRALSQRKSSG
ncbi:unnamed protein product [Musa acuminata var. zebrina]